jgi:hypothetical protein
MATLQYSDARGGTYTREISDADLVAFKRRIASESMLDIWTSFEQRIRTEQEGLQAR